MARGAVRQAGGSSSAGPAAGWKGRYGEARRVRAGQARAATLDELMAFIDKHNLAGQGCGYVDLSLLAATRLKPGLRLWTLDRRLATLAARLELAHFAASA